MKIYITFLIFFNSISILVQSQPKTEIFKNQYSLELGYSKSGTGDLGGIFITNSFTKQFKPKLHYKIGLSTSIHQNRGALIYTAVNGDRIDGTLRKVTAGLQLNFNYGYSFIRNLKHDFGISAGTVIRYQTTSIHDEVTGFYPSINGYGPGFFENYPFSLLSIINTGPQQTGAIGASLNLFYSYSLSKRLQIGIVTAFQFDTNGDVFKNICLKTGYRF
jgi:hypothetical protein